MQEQTWGKFHCTSCCWYSVWLRGAAGGVGGVGGEVSGETIQTYPYSNCTFHHQNSERVQTSFTLPTNLGKAFANITHCTSVRVSFSMLENRTGSMQEQTW